MSKLMDKAGQSPGMTVMVIVVVFCAVVFTVKATLYGSNSVDEHGVDYATPAITHLQNK